MTVLLTISETLDGAPVPDTLAGGGTGVDMGSVVNNQYAPLGSKASNTGHQNVYVSHDGVAAITDLKVFLQEYSQGTGFTYGGASTAVLDYATLKSMGLASGSSKNNGDGASGGLWMDVDSDASTANQFDHANFPSLVKIFGDNTTDGTTAGTAFPITTQAMVYNLPGETVASAPVSGSIGPAGNTVLGDAAHLKFRIYLPNTFPSGGIVQWEVVFVYSFTAALSACVFPTLWNLVSSLTGIL